MATVTVSMFGDKEMEVPDDEVEVLRGQGVLTSVDGVAEEARAAETAEGVLPPADLLSVGDKPPAPAKEEKGDGKAAK